MRGDQQCRVAPNPAGVAAGVPHRAAASSVGCPANAIVRGRVGIAAEFPTFAHEKHKTITSDFQDFQSTSPKHHIRPELE